MIGPEKNSKTVAFKNPFDYRIVHLVGIGGIGMSGIAEVLHNLGYEVRGSDMRDSESVERLRSLGIKVFVGHRPENVHNAHVVVISSAVSEDNPEVVEARRLHIPVIPRAEMLAEIGRLKYSILVAGAHGKTTTTSLIANVLSVAGIDPTIIVGGRFTVTGVNARLGGGDFLVAEADESDGSFLKLNPTIAVITNIDREHMDFFKDMESLKQAFTDFANKVPFYGLAILCIDNPYVRQILSGIKRRVITYGFSEDADVRLSDLESSERGLSFKIFNRGVYEGRYSIPLYGSHNSLNALAAFIVGSELGLDREIIRKGLASFSGIKRRLEFKGSVHGIRFYDDYGHHPTEIRATLRAVKESLLKEKGRLVLLFQPHRYTRTRDLIGEFSTCFGDADILFLMDIYPAGERPIEGVRTGVIYESIIQRSNSEKSGLRSSSIFYISDREELIKTVKKKLKEFDIVLTMGAGDVWKIGEELIKRLKHGD
ncbi:MAG: UDP-N-acetylmuramate--L-alanine ligase [Thermodesulfovibrionales bacterium]